MPKLVQDVLAICSDPKASVRQLAERVKVDEALSSRILRIVNSAYYGFHREIGNVDHALVVLGFEEVKNIALAACIIHAYPYESDRVFNREKFWMHSLCTAYTARALRKYVPEIISQDAFVIGLMHDFGKVVLSQLFHNHFIRSVTEAGKQNRSLHQVELEFADLNHAEVGGRVCEGWELPPALTRAVEFHHNPEEAYAHEYSIHLAHLANYFSHRANIGNSGNPVPDNVSLVSINAFGIQNEDLDEVWQSLGVDTDAIRTMIV
ncbi:HDOD domain-containing protein [Calditrichota bacterium]